MSQDAGPQAEAWTVRRILEWTTGYLKEHGSASPRLDAEVLLAHARGCSRIQLYTAFDEVLTDAVRGKMRELVKRRAGAEPVAYLVGYREFFSSRFRVTPGVFIPRPETETLVIQALDRLKGIASPKVLDLCTGSGCVAISIARSLAAAHVTAVELDLATLEIARQNAIDLGVSDRIEFLQGDLFAALASDKARVGLRPFDVIVSNPPYITSAEIPTLQRDVSQHEPHLALDGGPEGLDIIRPLIKQSPDHLPPGGWLLFEISNDQGEAVRRLLEADGRYTSITIVADSAGLPRVACGRVVQT